MFIRSPRTLENGGSLDQLRKTQIYRVEVYTQESYAGGELSTGWQSIGHVGRIRGSRECTGDVVFKYKTDTNSCILISATYTPEMAYMTPIQAATMPAVIHAEDSSDAPQAEARGDAVHLVRERS